MLDADARGTDCNHRRWWCAIDSRYCCCRCCFVRRNWNAVGQKRTKPRLGLNYGPWRKHSEWLRCSSAVVVRVLLSSLVAVVRDVAPDIGRTRIASFAAAEAVVVVVVVAPPLVPLRPPPRDDWPCLDLPRDDADDRTLYFFDSVVADSRKGPILQLSLLLYLYLSQPLSKFSRSGTITPCCWCYVGGYSS